MMPIGLILAALLPSIVLGVVILIYDRFEKEPLGLLIKIFFFGALAVIPSIIAEVLGEYFNFFGSSLLGLAIEAYIVVGLSEEFFKRWAVLRHAYKDPAYNEKLDGIVYCAFAALGFAAAENIGYVLTSYQTYPDIVWLRAVTSVPVHLMVGITMGYYLSLAKFSASEADYRRNKRRSLFVPMVLHGTYDFILFTQIPLLMLALVPFVIYLWVSSVKKLNRFYRESRDTYR